MVKFSPSLTICAFVSNVFHHHSRFVPKRLKLGQLLDCYSLCLLSSLSTIKLSEIEKYLFSRQTKSNYHAIYFFLPFRWPAESPQRDHGRLPWGVYHLSTNTENSGWQFKWYSSLHRKLSEKDGNLQTYSSFPVPTGMTGKSLHHL